MIAWLQDWWSERQLRRWLRAQRGTAVGEPTMRALGLQCAAEVCQQRGHRVFPEVGWCLRCGERK